MAEHPSAIDQAEMYFLIAHALAGGPFAHLGEALAKEAADHGVFPSRVDYTGARHPLSYDEARQRLSHLHPGSLQHALHQLLVFRRGEARGVASQGLSSLLDPAILPGAGGLPSLPGYAAKPPTWMLPLASAKRGGMGLPAAQFLMLRECGVLNTRGNVGMPPAALARHWEHHLTVRGHSFAAYCVVMDGTGRHVITGSDDRLVKVRDVHVRLR